MVSHCYRRDTKDPAGLSIVASGVLRLCNILISAALKAASLHTLDFGGNMSTTTSSIYRLISVPLSHRRCTASNEVVDCCKSPVEGCNIYINAAMKDASLRTSRHWMTLTIPLICEWILINLLQKRLGIYKPCLDERRTSIQAFIIQKYQPW